jgi:uncharacterized protein (DUF697 family)
MGTYEERVEAELKSWKRKVQRKPSMKKVVAKRIQNKINSKIPDKAHKVFTSAIKGMVEATIAGTSYMTKIDVSQLKTLEERENLVKERLQFYRKVAVAEGAGTGAGGILLGIADFPLLLSIKMKFLMECCEIYGFSVKELNERIFLLYVFQAAFSSYEHKHTIIKKIENWEVLSNELSEEDWRKLQQEYRDHIDLVKLLQLIPGFGAIVGAYANHQLLDELGETAMNCFRIRIINNTK